MSEFTGLDGPRPIDLDGDGTSDGETLTDPTTGQTALAADLDGDGALDVNAVDRDGDGLFEEAQYDTDRDGVIDTIGTDEDGDGAIETFAQDTDGDGEADTWQRLTASGTYEQVPAQAPTGQSPTQTSPGYPWPHDDQATQDATTDGAAGEPGGTRLDLDGDGVDDSVLVEDDESGVTVLMSDGDGDGELETALVDTDGDGLFETGASDTDGDGEPDMLATDTDGDGQVDTWEALDGGSDDPEGDGAETGPVDDVVEPETAAEDLPPIEPTAELTAEERSEIEGVFWQAQTENGYCGPTSVAIVLAEVYGVDVDAQDIVDTTIENGWLAGEPGNWSGMDVPDVEKLLESYGVAATTIEPASEAEAWAALETLTADDNYGVIAYIDADEVWTTTDDDVSDGGRAMDHAVVVTHVDENYVYLNDPGISTGEQARIDREQFMDAWADSGHQALVTDEPAPGGLADDTGTATAVEPSSGQERTSADAFVTGPTLDPAVDTSDGTGTGTSASPLDLSLDPTAVTAQPWRTSPDMDLLTAVLPGLRVAIIPVVLAGGALVAVAANRRQS